MQRARKTLLIRILHWSVFLLFIGVILSGYRQADSGWSGVGFFDRDMVHIVHETSGILIVILITCWALIRASKIMQFRLLTVYQKLLVIYHCVLAGLGLLIGMLGWMASSAGGYGQKLFGVLPMPNIFPKLGADWAVLLNSTHADLMTWFFIIAGVHIVSALFHLLVLRDGVFYSIWFSGKER